MREAGVDRGVQALGVDPLQELEAGEGGGEYGGPPDGAAVVD